MSDLALVGPTASGKTPIALGVAEEFDAEILCVDSMTVYRGMDIGTAKPTAAERALVAHHLLDIADPNEPFTVAMFQAAARAAREQLKARGRRALYVGGSGLYFRAAVDDLSLPPADAEVRARLEDEDLGALTARLKEQDPAAAAFVDPANKRRVVRALEVIEVTGQPFSSFRDDWDHYGDVVVAGLQVSADTLDGRVRARLRAMLERGLLDEVRGLLDRGYRDALVASKAIGYPQAIALLDGASDPEGFIEETARATRAYARRQMSWFRRDPRVVWFNAEEPQNAIAEVRAYYGRQLEGG